MKRFIVACAAFAVVIAATTSLQSVLKHGHSAVALAATSSPCAFPTTATGSPEQTAWLLFIAANCQANQKQVVWETWVEQTQLYAPPSSTQLTSPKNKRRRLHGSPLAAAQQRVRKHLHPQLFAPNTGCNTMNGRPPNVVNATICEEVHIDPVAAGLITTNGYEHRSAQAAAARKGVDIEFPAPAVEVKVDWIPATDFATPFTCANPPAGIHVESIDGVCYAMAGMHIISKLDKNWIWATFEPQSMLTNPLRCITFGSCNDSFGSLPAKSSGGQAGFTKPTQELAALMALAHLAPEFSNYRLDGAQVAFTTPSGTPTYLGNSVIEGENVGMRHNQASCITCHSYSSIKTDGTDGITLLPAAPVGPQYQVPVGWIGRDFVWSLLLAH